MQRLFLALVGIAASVLFLAAPAAAQDQWEQQVRAQLQQAGQRFESEGYVMTHRIFTGSLADDEKTLVTLTLDIGKDYYILGACDTDCTDLDLTIFDSTGKQIDTDVLVDDFPIVEASVARSGTFTIEVTMATCSAEPCRYGIGAFGK
jgi:hypothetical protein